ncbi:hypothetical protein G6514_001996 [Epicoccum nigrum]|nr:hypothetical protein G6514_001996 [Epicoccum nigrum]
MVASGLLYMIPVVNLGMYAVHKTLQAKAAIVERMHRAGVRLRSRDKFFAIFTGVVEKMFTSALFFGHDEMQYLTAHFGFSGHLFKHVSEVSEPALLHAVSEIVGEPTSLVTNYWPTDHTSDAVSRSLRTNAAMSGATITSDLAKTQMSEMTRHMWKSVDEACGSHVHRYR